MTLKSSHNRVNKRHVFIMIRLHWFHLFRIVQIVHLAPSSILLLLKAFDCHKQSSSVQKRDRLFLIGCVILLGLICMESFTIDFYVHTKFGEFLSTRIIYYRSRPNVFTVCCATSPTKRFCSIGARRCSLLKQVFLSIQLCIFFRKNLVEVIILKLVIW